MKIVTVVGARPQFIKAAALSRRIRHADFAGLVSETIIHTGQHYDDNMSDRFFRDLGLPEPAVNLGVGGGTHGRQIGDMMVGLEAVLPDLNPDLVLVYGDTNSTLAAALVAARMARPLAHVEAGLRSFRAGMAEEINRIVTDRLSRLLFCPTARAVRNLEAEGRRDGVYQVGDIMLDGFRHAVSETGSGKRTLTDLGVAAGRYVLVTLHRAENTDDPARLRAILEGLGRFGDTGTPILLPLHPRSAARIEAFGIAIPEAIRLVPPQPYHAMVALLMNAAAVATDSGGLQKEACFARTPCVTLRDETEWTETVETGWNRLVPADPEAVRRAIEAATVPVATPPPDYGDGDAAGKILRAIVDWGGSA